MDARWLSFGLLLATFICSGSAQAGLLEFPRLEDTQLLAQSRAEGFVLNGFYDASSGLLAGSESRLASASVFLNGDTRHTVEVQGESLSLTALIDNSGRLHGGSFLWIGGIPEWGIAPGSTLLSALITDFAPISYRDADPNVPEDDLLGFHFLLDPSVFVFGDHDQVFFEWWVVGQRVPEGNVWANADTFSESFNAWYFTNSRLVVPVSAPSTLALMLIGLLALVLIARYHKAAMLM